MYTIYTKEGCIYCTKAKQLIKLKGLDSQEIFLETNADIKRFKEQFPDQRTLPLILLNDKQIGGFNKFEAHVEKLWSQNDG